MVSENDGPFVMFEVPNEDTGQIERKFVSVRELFNVMWDDYVKGFIPDEYARGMLEELNLTPYEVFHMMERLQGGKAEYERSDYKDVSYI